nr:serine/threonine kinese protein [Salmonid herpesvirus 1]UNP64431.1 putative serine/threonine kinase-like protein [Salmonid herpesvirus 1]
MAAKVPLGGDRFVKHVRSFSTRWEKGNYSIILRNVQYVHEGVYKMSDGRSGRNIMFHLLVHGTDTPSIEQENISVEEDGETENISWETFHRALAEPVQPNYEDYFFQEPEGSTPEPFFLEPLSPERPIPEELHPEEDSSPELPTPDESTPEPPPQEVDESTPEPPQEVDESTPEPPQEVDESTPEPPQEVDESIPEPTPPKPVIKRIPSRCQRPSSFWDIFYTGPCNGATAHVINGGILMVPLFMIIFIF